MGALLAALRSAIPDVFVSHHAAAEEGAIIRGRDNAGRQKLVQQLLALSRRDPDKTPDLRGCHRAAVDHQVAIGLTLVRNAEHVYP
jgi:hypothetical protein